MYDKDGRVLPATGLHADLPKEVFELKKSFPNVDFDALSTALAVSDNNVDLAKAVSLCWQPLINIVMRAIELSLLSCSQLKAVEHSLFLSSM